MSFYEELCECAGSECVKKDEPMSAHTTFKVGGNADFFVTPSPGDIKRVLKVCRESGQPVMVMGNGSNLLVADEGIRGVVICMSGDAFDASCDGEEISAYAGVKLSAIAQIAAENELAGFEFASGIPGTLGGAVLMNAGAYGREMKDVLSSATVIDREGNLKVLDASELELSYRHSNVYENGYTVIEASIALEFGDEEKIRKEMKTLNMKRVEKQPLELPSAGSTFKRPKGGFAAKLIDEAGLKGRSVGGAMVSEKHCGFVVNTGGATAQDIFGLMRLIRDEVKKKSGITLEPEVRFVGEWKETL